MELHQLAYFVAVVETGSFSKAAARSNVAQPSLSQQIMKLEQKLGTPLFDRSGRTVSLTDAGMLLYPKAKTILAEVKQARHIVERHVSGGRGTLSVGIIPTVAPFLIHGSVMAFQQQYPDVELSITEDTTEQLLERLVNAELDVAYLSEPIKNRLVTSVPLFSEALFVAVSRTNTVSELPVVESATLSQYPFIMLHDQHCLTAQTESFCYAEQIRPQMFCRTSQLATVLEFVRANVGIALVPECAVAHYEGDDIAFLPIKEHAPQRTIVASRHHNRADDPLANAFSACLSDAWVRLTQGQAVRR
jgi:LysR family hydrogen peroxide-inducible transcriptional activator